LTNYSSLLIVILPFWFLYW